jgi:hypothetical protein
LIVLGIELFIRNSNHGRTAVPAIRSGAISVPTSASPAKPTSDTSAVQNTNKNNSTVKPDTAGTVNSTIPAAATEKIQKKLPPVGNAEIHKSPKSQGNKNDIYILLLSTNETCNVKINEEDYGTIKAGKQPIKVYLPAGTYQLHAISQENPARTMNGKLQVTEDNLHDVGSYKITF